MRPPLPGRVTPHGYFGAPRVKRTGGARLHEGLDLGGRPGAVAVAPISGTVIAAEARDVPPWRGYAPVVAILSPDRQVLHLVSHLQPDFRVRVGQAVTEGQPIGQVGRLAHVHWEIRRRGQAVNPDSERGPGWVAYALAAAVGVALAEFA